MSILRIWLFGLLTFLACNQTIADDLLETLDANFRDGFEDPKCPNGMLDLGEQCDDGNLVETDGCTSLCRTAPPCDIEAFPGGDRFAVAPATGHCYVSFDSEMTTFSEAQAACVLLDGHLATITSSAEQALILSVLNPLENPWIGAVDDENDTDSIFEWVTAEPFIYSAFAPGEPDDDVLVDGMGDCLHITNAQGQWADTNCNLSAYVTGRICEINP